MVQQDVTAWQEEEAAKRAREHAKVMHFKELQDEQVADKQARVRKVRRHRALLLRGTCARRALLSSSSASAGARKARRRGDRDGAAHRVRGAVRI